MNNLSLCIKKTNKHLYLYLLQGHVQMFSVSTDSRYLKNIILQLSPKEVPEYLAHVFAYKLLLSGVSVVYYKSVNRYHGKVATVIETLRKLGVSVK